jgi:hypothetical protein
VSRHWPFISLTKETELRFQDLCVSAVLAAVKETIGKPDWESIRKHTHLKPEPKSETPSAEQKAESNESQPNGGSQITPESKAPTRVITKAHFMHALEEILPSFSDKAKVEMHRWHKANSSGPKTSRGKATK